MAIYSITGKLWKPINWFNLLTKRVRVFVNYIAFKTIDTAILIAFISLISSIILESRAFCIGYVISGLCLFLLKYPQKRKRILLIGLVVITISIVVLVFFIKPDSSLGRILVYKITYTIFKDHWLWGVGFGKFNLNYLHYQAAYFSTGNYNNKELLLADNTQFAFNDYWQFILESGIIGCVFLILFFLLVSYLTMKALRKNIKNPGLLLIAISQMIAIGIAALMMHEYEHFLIQSMTVVALTVTACYAYPIQASKIVGVGIVGLCTLTYCNFGFYLKNYTNFQKMEEAQNLLSAGYLNESLTSYRQLFGELKEDPFYLVKYSEVLSAQNNNQEAEQVLKLALRKQCTNLFYDKLAQLYYREGKFKEAEDAYLTSIYMVPNRFKTRYDLFLFYCNTSKRGKAIQTGKELIRLPTKVPSESTNIILRSVTNKLHSLRIKTNKP